MVKTPVNPDILRWARESANLTIEDVTIKIKKSPEVIDSWENGLDSPSYAQLEKLAYDVYKRPVAIFFFPNIPKEDNIKKSFRTLSELDFGRLPPTLIRQIRKAIVKQSNLYELCNNENPSESKIIEKLLSLKSYDVIKLSRELRRLLDVSLDEQKGFTSIEATLEKWRFSFESHGIFIFKEAFRNDDFSGFCLYDKIFPVIILNNSMPKTRQIFTLFHELGHLLFETSGIDKLKDDFINRLPEQDRNIEILCNRLAAEILVPIDDFEKIIKGVVINETSISELADIYKVSREVILRKFFDKGLVNDSTYVKLATKWMEEATKKKQERPPGGSYYNNQIAYLGDRYLELAFDSYYKNNISEMQLAEYLNVKMESLPTLESSLHRRWTR